jgi:excisionase family DNA binding protein
MTTTAGKYAALKDFVSTKAIADRFGVALRDVQYYIKQGVIPAYKVGYTYLIHIDDIPSSWPPA